MREARSGVRMAIDSGMAEAETAYPGTMDTLLSGLVYAVSLIKDAKLAHAAAATIDTTEGE